MQQNFKQIKKKTSNFTIVSNAILQDKNLSLKAKGLLITLLSLPPRWHFTEKGLAAATGEGLASIRSGLKELEENKYLYRYQSKAQGKFANMNYIVFEEPTDVTNNLQDSDDLPICENQITDSAEIQKTVMRKSDIGKNDIGKTTQYNTYNNKELKKIKNQVNNSDNNALNDNTSSFVLDKDHEHYNFLNGGWMNEG